MNLYLFCSLLRNLFYEKLDIPVPPLDIQNKIAEAYLARVDEYKVCQAKLEDVTNRMNSVFDDNYEG